MTTPKRRPARPKAAIPARSKEKSQRNGPHKLVAILREDVDVVHEFVDSDARKVRGKAAPSRTKATTK